MKELPFTRRLKHATAGLAVVWHRESSFRSQAVLAAAVVIVGVVAWPQIIWWAVLMLAIGLVLVAEIINSSIEALAGHLHPSEHPSIKIAKDMAAAAVLVASFVAVAVGACLALSMLPL